jgi:hypothetical protein
MIESQNNSHLVCIIRQCVFGLFLKSASQIVCLQWTRGLIGSKFGGNLGSLPGFGNIITSAFFQDAGSDKAEGSV